MVQWLVSERNRDSVVPVAFWWFSLFGGLALLAYAISRHDPVIIFGQAMGLVVYVRNLMLVAKANAGRRAGYGIRPILSGRLPIDAGHQSGDREILIQIRPMQADPPPRRSRSANVDQVWRGEELETR